MAANGATNGTTTGARHRIGANSEARDGGSTHATTSGSATLPVTQPTQSDLKGGVDLTAAIVAVDQDEPLIFVIEETEHSENPWRALPSGPFTASVHQTLDGGLHAWVSAQTAIDLGYTEQLYSVADANGISIAYLALARTAQATASANGRWQSWYTVAPWEDWRRGRPKILGTMIEPYLRTHLRVDDGAPTTTADRARLAFGLDGAPWHEDRVLERFDVLTDARYFEHASGSASGTDGIAATLRPGHARVMAAAIGRLRAKVKARPVLFELMDDQFTLFELQKTVEAILGPHLHKQNFRRLVESAGLVEETGNVRANTGGRPAKLFRYRDAVLWEG